MLDYRKHFIIKKSSIKEALIRLNTLAFDAILFVVDEEDRLLGSLTDGDVRRGFLKGLELTSIVDDFVQMQPKYICKGEYTINDIIEYRNKNFKILPVVDKKNRVINIVNFRFFKSYLPLDAVIMAGGRGQRLSPMTDSIPKPLLKIGDKPIIEHNLDRLISFGIDDFWISVKYLGEQIVDFLGTGENKNVSIQYLWEDEPLGTIGAVSKIKEFTHDYVLITNSDLLTNIDYEDFFCTFLDAEADISIATIPYLVNVPYAILHTEEDTVISFKEKPTYTYYANAGIYLIKKKVANIIPQGTFFNATDLIESCIDKGLKVKSYPLRGYWLDIGKPEDFAKAQEDIKHI